MHKTKRIFSVRCCCWRPVVATTAIPPGGKVTPPYFDFTSKNLSPG